jgi:hypothetical protein
LAEGILMRAGVKPCFHAIPVDVLLYQPVAALTGLGEPA